MIIFYPLFVILLLHYQCQVQTTINYRINNDFAPFRKQTWLIFLRGFRNTLFEELQKEETQKAEALYIVSNKVKGKINAFWKTFC